jgi:transcription termination/antitermination protein NusG
VTVAKPCPDRRVVEKMSSGNPLLSVASTEASTEFLDPRWYAAYTRAHHEKRVAEQLQNKSVESFLPLYSTVRQWKNGRAHLQLPLFPGYVFVHMSWAVRLQVMEMPGVVRILSRGGKPVPVPDSDIELLKNGLAELRAEPHPYLAVGKKVRVKAGPLRGAVGILLRKKPYLRLVLAIDMIMRSVVVEVDAVDVERIPATDIAAA